MISLTCYGGVGQIGGNKMLLEDGETRLFFDFGTPFGESYNYFEEFLKPRPGAGLLDVLATGLLPPLRGLYRTDLEPSPELWERFEASPLYRELQHIDAVLLSHAHLDHSGYISFLRCDVPIYASSMTAFVAKAIQDTGNSGLDQEICYVNPRACNDGYLSSDRSGSYQQRPYVFLDAPLELEKGTEFWARSPRKKKALEPAACTAIAGCVGPLPLRHFPVDHSIFGATAYAIETSSGWVAYTGDLRLHGTFGGQTERFVQETAQLRPRVLLCEGTRAGSDRQVSEQEVHDNCLRAAKAENGLIIADFGPRNVERLLTFLSIAGETGRTLAILAKDAYLLDAMHLASSEVPDLTTLPHVSIFQDLRGQVPPWMDGIYRRYAGKLMAAADVRQNPGDYLLCFSFWEVNELIDIQPKGGLYIYSSSEAYSEEQQMDRWRLGNWLKLFGMTAVGLEAENEAAYHASGHASGPELLDIIRAICPQTLVTIHTEAPGYFAEGLRGSGIEVVAPEHGRPLGFS